MENYKYKIVIELNDSKIRIDRKYDLEDTYRIVREQFIEKGLNDVSNEKQLIFVSKPEDSNAYGVIGAVTNALYRSWIKPYLKVMEWHDVTKNSVEDLLKTFKACEETVW